ncbi:hypothetical protein H6F76_27470 [Leptolyngbya sp. FACHB-321]|uniref:tellurite resistance TerB C-terminal domain-containing protein n=1 Tax=Leptolyngbya sp. FACHB-321 TaxID=2692807 RepID=UPI00168585BE|nr:tellurite resistance TerB C-terminal domain-containing protein [Leptolyngbya sp. FACHB-321]MBD2038699.1 hypothetical protein [Leptolyngbya sp. FACHB-321]
MVKQRLFLGSVAFGISFGISFLTGRGLGSAIASGVTTMAATVVAAAVVDRQQHQHAHSRIAELKNHIQALQQRRAEAYQAYMQLEAEKEHLAISLNTLAFQSGQPSFQSGQRYITESPAPRMLPASPRPLSWNLAASAVSQPSVNASTRVPAYELPTEISASGVVTSSPDWGRSETQISPQILSDAAAAKQKIEISLAALQTELRQIKGHITDHRQTREKLSRDVADIREEKRQLDATVKTLRGEVQELEPCRVELEQFLAYAEAKKQELESGSNPLQEALKQLQTQVELLQEELRELEVQILDRRSQKELLEQQVAALNALQQASQAPLVVLEETEVTSKNGSVRNGGSNNQGDATAVVRAKKTIVTQETAAKRPTTIAKPARPLKSGAGQFSTAAVLPEPLVADKPSTELPNEWTEFMVQSPEYELQVLKVIVEQNNPAAVLKHIAEENLTMPELLIDSINERALETIGDLLIDASAGAGSAAIVRDHLKAVKKLLRTYEYLVN